MNSQAINPYINVPIHLALEHLGCLVLTTNNSRQLLHPYRWLWPYISSSCTCLCDWCWSCLMFFGSLCYLKHRAQMLYNPSCPGFLLPRYTYTDSCVLLLCYFSRTKIDFICMACISNAKGSGSQPWRPSSRHHHLGSSCILVKSRLLMALLTPVPILLV